jgi:hypothetical protein
MRTARKYFRHLYAEFNPLNAESNPICPLLALFGAHHILHVSRLRVKCNVVLTDAMKEYGMEQSYCATVSYMYS